MARGHLPRWLVIGRRTNRADLDRNLIGTHDTGTDRLRDHGIERNADTLSIWLMLATRSYMSSDVPLNAASSWPLMVISPAANEIPVTESPEKGRVVGRVPKTCSRDAQRQAHRLRLRKPHPSRPSQ